MKPIKSTVLEEKIYQEYDKNLRNWGMPYEETIVINKFGNTHVILAGDKQSMPLIMLHDASANSSIMWSANITELSKEYYCVLIDILGSPGKSIPGKRYFNDLNHHAWLDSVLMELNIEKCYAIGVGMGADILLNYMVYNPDIIKAVSIEGGLKLNRFNTILPFFGFESRISSKEFLLKKLIRHVKTDQNVVSRQREIFFHFLLLSKAYNPCIMKYHRLENYKIFELKQLKDKILFLFGERGIDDNLELINQVIQSGFNYTIVEDAGHMLLLEKPEIINSYLNQFFDKV